MSCARARCECAPCALRALCVSVGWWPARKHKGTTEKKKALFSKHGGQSQAQKHKKPRAARTVCDVSDLCVRVVSAHCERRAPRVTVSVGGAASAKTQKHSGEEKRSFFKTQKAQRDQGGHTCAGVVGEGFPWDRSLRKHRWAFGEGRGKRYSENTTAPKRRKKKAFSAKPGRRHAKQRGPHVGRVVGEGFRWEGLSRKEQGASQEGRGKEMRENEKTRTQGKECAIRRLLQGARAGGPQKGPWPQGGCGSVLARKGKGCGGGGRRGIRK